MGGLLPRLAGRRAAAWLRPRESGGASGTRPRARRLGARAPAWAQAPSPAPGRGGVRHGHATGRSERALTRRLHSVRARGLRRPAEAISAGSASGGAFRLRGSFSPRGSFARALSRALSRYACQVAHPSSRCLLRGELRCQAVLGIDRARPGGRSLRTPPASRPGPPAYSPRDASRADRPPPCRRSDWSRVPVWRRRHAPCRCAVWGGIALAISALAGRAPGQRVTGPSSWRWSGR